MKTVVGTPITIHMEGNPSTGYAWHLNKHKSRGLSAVRLKSGSWSDASTGHRLPTVGEAMVFSVEVAPVRAETVVLVYEYRRKWENKPAVKQRSYEIIITDTEG